MMGLSIIIPAYNEALNLNLILPRINNALKPLEFEINVIDSMQPIDNTEEICIKNKANCIRRNGGNNYGDAIRSGIESCRYEYSLIMDSDGSHSPEDIPRLLDEIADNDLVIGSRYIRDGKTQNPKILIWMSWIVNVFFRLFLNLKVKDVSNSFRLYKTAHLKSVNLECSNFDIVEEILIKLLVLNPEYKIKEVPIVFNKRMHGESKRDLVKFVFSYVSTLTKLCNLKIKARKQLKESK